MQREDGRQKPREKIRLEPEVRMCRIGGRGTRLGGGREERNPTRIRVLGAGGLSRLPDNRVTTSISRRIHISDLTSHPP